MKIPGFTASTSLYNTGGHYRVSGGNPSAWSNAPAVVPQLPRQLGLLQCLQGCSLAGADPACEVTCFRKADIQASDDFQSGGGGPRGPRRQPELVCGPCVRGRQRCGIPGLGFSYGPCLED